MDYLRTQGLRRISGGYLLRADDTSVGLRGRDEASILWIGPRALVRGSIDHSGSVVLAARCHVQGSLRGGHEVTLGANTRVNGAITATGRVVVQDGAQAGNIHAGSDVFLFGSCTVGDVVAGGDVIVVGSPTTGALSPGGRVTARDF